MEAKEVPLPEQQESEDHFNLPPITVAYVKNIPVRDEPKMPVLGRVEGVAFTIYMLAAAFYIGVLFAVWFAERRKEES